MTKCELKRCLYKEGFFKVPNRPYSVNEQGLVFDYASLSVVERTAEKFGSYKHIGKTHAHVLVAETFIPKPESERQRFTVNHKDGRKWNNSLDNLEWLSYSDNSYHAYENSLRTDNLVLKSKNLLTNCVTEYYSLINCSKHFGVNPSRVHGYINRKRRNVLFLGKHLLVRKNEEFPEETDYKTWLTDSSYRDLAIINNGGKTVLFTNKITDVSDHLRISIKEAEELLQSLKKSDLENISYGEYTICRPNFVLETVQWGEKHDLRIKEKPSFVKPVRKPLRIIVEDLNTGLVSELESAENLADKLGVSKNTFQSHISRHNGIWKQRLKVTYKGPVGQ